MKEKKWAVAKPHTRVADKISRKLGILPLTARLLAIRGIASADEAETFLSPSLNDLPSPFLMKGMVEAVDRLKKALYEKEKVAVYGDFDVDGVTATVVVWSFLKEVGCDASYYIPDRFSEGYGVNSAAVRKLASDGVGLVVSVDCGITAASEVREASGLGMDFVITDHHGIAGELPPAAAVLNPHREGCGYPSKEITGVGVAFNLVLALRRTLREEGFFVGKEPNLGNCLDLVSLGTVADCAPVRNANRIMLKEGLERMAKPNRQGIRALKEVSGMKDGIEAFDLGFRLAPRINAAGRLDSACVAVELMVSRDRREALSLAERLDRLNSERREIEEKTRDDAIRMVEEAGGYTDHLALVLFSEQWHRGVVGIVASSLCEIYGKPVFLVAVDETGMGRGSGRSFGGIDIFTPLSKCSDILDEFGGHRHAAGISVRRDRIDLFRKRFSEELKKSGQKPDLKLVIDAEIGLSSITDDLVSQIESLSPFGEGNPEPLFLSKSVEVTDLRKMKEKHLSFSVRGEDTTLRCVWFYARELELPEKIDMVFSPRFDEWKKEKGLRLFIKDARSSTE